MYKKFYRWHMSPVKIAKCFPKANNACWKCRQNVGMWFYVVKAEKYWRKIQMIIQEIIKKKVPLIPELFLLNVIPEKYRKPDITYM